MLARGFFPFEVPPCFTSNSFGSIGRASGAPPEFLLRKPGRYPSAQMARHNLARKGKLRRVLGVPNPIIYYNTACEVVDSWSVLDAFLNRSRRSVTRIIADPSAERALTPANGPPDFPRLRARYRTNRKYLLVADVQQFYPSLYTHSIPWAVHGKDTAKQNKTDWSLVGNRLDFWARQAQDQQTRGVPIGPDTSRLVAELVMTAVDIELQRRVKNVRGFRALDDFELSFRTRSDAESALSELQSILAMFDLQLNETKTQILELPLPLDSMWTARLRDFKFPPRGTRKVIGALTEYFGLAFQTARDFPTESVLKYAISRAAGRNWTGAPWQTYQDLLLQCATAEPGVLPITTSELRRYQSRGHTLDEDRIRELVEVTVVDHAPLGHGSEVLWALWMLVALKFSYTPTTEMVVSRFDDPLVPLVALHARSEGLTGADLDSTAWEQRMTLDDLMGPHWLCAYEAGVRNWLPTRSRKKHHVDQDPRFKFLRSKNVRFYNTRASALHVRRWRPRMTLEQLIGYGI